jgi:hypothetical protein
MDGGEGGGKRDRLEILQGKKHARDSSAHIHPSHLATDRREGRIRTLAFGAPFFGLHACYQPEPDPNREEGCGEVRALLSQDAGEAYLDELFGRCNGHFGVRPDESGLAEREREKRMDVEREMTEALQRAETVQFFPCSCPIKLYTSHEGFSSPIIPMHHASLPHIRRKGRLPS